MNYVLKQLKKVRFLSYCNRGRLLLNNPAYIDGKKKTEAEKQKTPVRTDVLNFLLAELKRETTYLEIGVRNPADNYDHIKADVKYSVDPGIEFEENPVSFNLTSDEFFSKLDKNEILKKDTRFDVIYIDGLHLAEQVDRDIINSLKYIKDDGFIVLHDCNPPSIWHAREDYEYEMTGAGGFWNGTGWKAFLKWRFNDSVSSCCIDTDFGVGIISKKRKIGKSIPPSNLFFEYNVFAGKRREYLNLMDFGDFETMLKEEK